MDGLLLLAGHNDQPAFRDGLANLEIPCVTVDRDLPNVPSVRSDHRGGGLEATRHLIGLGHRRIALLTGRINLLPSAERLAGYEQAHIEACIPIDRALLRPQNQATSFAFSDVYELLKRPDRPTAIITMGTHMLASVMEALASTHMQYPRDVSLVCIGDTDLARYATPSISTVTWSLNEMGRIAAGMLIDRIKGVASGDPQTIHLPTRFILRNSTATPQEKRA
jgi:LacI family transcriptional regulator